MSSRVVTSKYIMVSRQPIAIYDKALGFTTKLWVLFMKTRFFICEL